MYFFISLGGYRWTEELWIYYSSYTWASL